MTFLEALESLLALIGGQLGRTAELHATGLRTGSAIACTSLDQLTLELGKTAQHRQHQPAVRRRRIRPSILEGFEARTLPWPKLSKSKCIFWTTSEV